MQAVSQSVGHSVVNLPAGPLPYYGISWGWLCLSQPSHLARLEDRRWWWVAWLALRPVIESERWSVSGTMSAETLRSSTREMLPPWLVPRLPLRLSSRLAERDGAGGREETAASS